MRPSPFATKVFVTFLPMAFVGTMLHEAGHIAVARGLGYKTTLHYGSMSWEAEDWGAVTNFELHSTLISLGGPLTNMGLGILGLLWLARLARDDRREFRGQVMAAAILTLFWSRQLFNGVLVAGAAMIGADRAQTDEVKIANELGWPSGSILWTTAGLAAVAIWKTITHLPREQRRPFILAGGTGALVGYGIWYLWLGPIYLP